jgi:hypothetical protein
MIVWIIDSVKVYDNKKEDQHNLVWGVVLLFLLRRWI